MRPPESFLGQPVRSLQTMLRVIAENSDDYPSVIPDGIYGNQTMSAVSNFQRNKGLPITGIADQDTWDAIVLEYEDAIIQIGPAEPLQIILNPGETIFQGQQNPNIYLVQAILAVFADAYNSIPAPAMTGILDIPTAQAISQFQILNSIPNTGQLDRQTWRLLALHYPSAATAGAAQQPMRSVYPPVY